MQNGAWWSTMEEWTPRDKSVSLPVAVAQRVSPLAKTQRKSTHRVLIELIESGLDAKEMEKSCFLTLPIV
jgi:hypothetical protein